MDFPLDFIPNSGSQLERALRAYHIAQGARPDVSKPNSNIFITLDTGERSNPCRTILAHGGAEDTPFTGNRNWSVTIVDQFDAFPPDGIAHPELHRVAIDRQVGLMAWWMNQTADQRTLLATAKNITDAGRALLPQSLTIVSCGEAGAKGQYARNASDESLWENAATDYRIIYNSTSKLWELQDDAEVVLFTAPRANFPHGTWTADTGQGALPVAKGIAQDPAWLNADMSNFTCMFVVPAGQQRGEGKDEEGITDGTWREVHNFLIRACPRKVTGYSNDD